MKVKWEEPPAPHPGRRPDADPFVATLKRNPGRWAVYKEAASGSVAAGIQAGRTKRFQPAGEWEATSRSLGEGKFKVYVRYVGVPMDQWVAAAATDNA